MLQSIGRYAHRGRPIGPLISENVWTSSSIARRRSHNSSNVPLDLPALDKKWQRIWEERRILEKTVKSAKQKKGGGDAATTRDKMYILPMFPYPSGDLHIGHLRVYTIADVLARFRRMQCYDVIHPIGWDAFGLPAENAAIERGIDPAEWTLSNIKKMKMQLKTMNGHWDWDRELATCDPEFYKHTQHLFLLLHESGLAYQAESMVNYDPVDKTVLANEQVDANGFSWRSGAKVEKRLLKQWFLKISDYRQDLLDGLKELSSEWPERVLSMQKNWLGKSTGAKIKFAVKGTAHSAIEVFTTRPDTLFGAQYLALASIHPLVQELAAIDKDLEAFVKAVPTFPPDSKIGYLLPNIEAINPLASEESTPDFAKEALPIYVAPYVLGDYGDGAVMGVPGHDTRDHSFWKYNKGDKPIKTVVTSVGKSEKNDASPFIHAGQLTSECGPYSGLTSVNATTQIVQFLESKDLGSAAETWRLRDWLISRQRYWGTPIPIIHCETCGPVPVPVEQLPVELPPLKSGSMNEKTGNALDHAHDWVKTLCPKCHGPAKRDTDTMDTFVDSSWYFMRFIDPHNKAQLFSPEIAARLLPVDVYIGGVEHAILHLLYARFISKFLSRSFNSKIRGEPFKQVLTQGMVHGKTYSDPKTGRFLKPAEMKLTSSSKPVIKATGKTPNVSFEKMSKSKYNGVDPGMCMDQYGADTTRAHILFQAPVTEVLEWDDGRIAGVTRWLRRIHDHIESRISWWTQDEHLTSQSIHFDPKEFLLTDLASRPNYALDHSLIKKVWEDEKVLWRAVQSTIMSVTTSYGKTYSLNTVVSDLMALTNAIINFSDTQIPNEGRRSPALHYAATKMLVQMMAPITPAFSEECWTLLHTVESFKSQGLYHSPPNNDTLTRNSVFDSRFPIEDGTLSLLAPETQKCAVQVNGKLKFAVELSLTELARKHGKALEKWIVGEILGTEEGTKWKDRLDGTDVKKVIVVRGGKTVNFVLSEKGASKM